MKPEQDADTVISLSALLDKERDGLLRGALDEVAQMLPQKEALIEALRAFPPAPQPDLIVLNEKVQRNHLLLGSALEGIRNIADRMAAVQRIQTSLETYGADGKRRTVKLHATRSVEKRA